MISFVIPVIHAMLQLLTHFAIGFWLRRRNLFPVEFFSQLSRFLVRLVLPIYYFVRMVAVDVEAIVAALFFPLAALVITAVGFLVSFALTGVFGFTGRTRRAGIALGTFGNTGFMPLFMVEIFPLSVPIIETTFGINTPLLFLGAFTLVQSPLLWAFGNYLVGGSLARPRWNELLSPPLFGIAFGLLIAVFGGGALLQDRSLPFFHVYTSLEKVGIIIFPLMIICLGATIADLKRSSMRSSERLVTLAFIVAAVRFIALPALFLGFYFAVLRPFGWSGAHTWVLFLQTHIPPGTALSIMAVQAGVNEGATAFVLLVNYLLYLVVLPVFVIMLFSLPGVL